MSLSDVPWYAWLGLAALAALIVPWVVSRMFRAVRGSDDDDGSERTG